MTKKMKNNGVKGRRKPAASPIKRPVIAIVHLRSTGRQVVIYRR